MTEALAILEIPGWSPAMVVLDAMKKNAAIRILQTELNDAPGVCLKLAGSVSDLQSATRAAQETAAAMQVAILTHVIPRRPKVPRRPGSRAPTSTPSSNNRPSKHRRPTCPTKPASP